MPALSEAHYLYSHNFKDKINIVLHILAFFLAVSVITVVVLNQKTKYQKRIKKIVRKIK